MDIPGRGSARAETRYGLRGKALYLLYELILPSIARRLTHIPEFKMPPSALTEKIKMQEANGDSAPREVSKSQGMSVSPMDSFHSPATSASWGIHHQRRQTDSLRASAAGTAPMSKLLKPFKEEDIKILLLENVNQTGKDILSQQGYQVESIKSSLPEDQLIEKIKCFAPETVSRFRSC